ncbi:hypothetical protein M0657_000674 [Pyricularia oryzae]|nr:hypothetical protein M9X92_002500 [Pyricularia oryzae]KAI7932235.1 hypothetical protein M0657_000674 [Pyricularia oryzae]
MTADIRPQKALTGCNVNLQRKWVKIDRFRPPYQSTSEGSNKERKKNLGFRTHERGSIRNGERGAQGNPISGVRQDRRHAVSHLSYS